MKIAVTEPHQNCVLLLNLGKAESDIVLLVLTMVIVFPVKREVLNNF
jgi:hypothetical protein